MAETKLGPRDEPSIGRRSFSSEDPLLSVVRDSLSASPARKEELTRLFATPLSTARGTIVAVRSGDIVTALNSLISGRIPLMQTEPTASRIRFKEPGWFYMTPLYSHPFYDEEEQQRLKGRNTGGFMEVVQENIEANAHSIAFATSFSRNVIPVLVEGWRASAAEMVRQSLDDREINDSSIFEDYMDYLKRELVGIRSSGVSLEDTLQRRRYGTRYPYLNCVVNHLAEGVDPIAVANFLSDAEKTRGGIVIGFNRNVIQGASLSDADPGYVIHGKPELAVKPESGFIDLSDSVVAIESLGVYEDAILSQLGLAA